MIPRRIAATVLLWSLWASAAVAQPAVITNALGPQCNFVTGRLSPACVPLFIGHLIQLVFGLVGTFFLFNVMYAGYQFAMGAWSGDKSKGKDRLQWSIIGLIVCASAFLILDVVLTVFLVGT